MEIVSVSSLNHPAASEALRQIRERGDFVLLYIPSRPPTSEQIDRLKSLLRPALLEQVKADVELKPGRCYVLPCCAEHIIRNGWLRLLRFPSEETGDASAPALDHDSYQRVVRDAAILSALADGVIITDQAGTILEMNPAALRLHGCGSLAEARIVAGYSRHIDVCDTSDNPLAIEDMPVMRVIREGHFNGLVLKLVDHDRQLIQYLSYSGQLIEHGTAHYAILTVRDITRAEIAHQRSQQNELLFKAAVDYYPGPFVIFDFQQRVRYINSKAADVIGLRPEEIIGLRCEDFPSCEWFAHYLPALKRTYQTRKVHQVEISISSGEEKYDAQTTFVPIIDNEGHILRTLCITRDLTEVHKAKRRIEQLNAQLENQAWQLRKTVSELESFSYAVAHDLLAPLRAMVGFSQVLREDYASELDADGRHFALRIEEAALRMSRLLDDILKLSRISVQEFTRKNLDLACLARELVEEHRSHATGVTVHIPERMDANGDEGLLRIALHNLLSNAIKYSRDVNRPEIRVGVMDGELPVYFIKDNGVGFDETKTKSMFKPFHRFHESEKFEGNGIGLAIVRRAIERHGGRIWARSTEGEGATFFFTLG